MVKRKRRVVAAYVPAESRSWNGQLPDDLAWILVSAKAEKPRMAELAVLGPLRKGHLGNQLGTDPMDPPLASSDPDERRIILSQRIELSTDVQQRLDVVSGTHLPGE